MRYIATIGFFDGVHRGHLFLIQQLIERAGQKHLSSMLITFGDHPRLTLEGQSPELLLTREEREERLKQSGVNQVVEFNFSVIQNMTAEEFMGVLHDRCEVDVLLMGYDHRFGSDRLQDFEAYRQAGLRAGIQVELAPRQPRIPENHADPKRLLRVQPRGGALRQRRIFLSTPCPIASLLQPNRHRAIFIRSRSGELIIQAARTKCEVSANKVVTIKAEALQPELGSNQRT